MESVSVVIPTHNRADLVGVAISSVTNQADASVEVIVVDDGSTDETQEVLRSFGAAIEVIRRERPIERGAARNLGVAGSCGAVIAFLDSDDEWEPHKLTEQLQMLRPGTLVMSGLRYIDGSGAETGQTYVPPAGAEARLHLFNPFLGSPSSLLLHRATFERIGGFPEELAVQGSEDWLFLLAARAGGFNIAVHPEPLVRYRIHAGNFTGDADRVASSMWAACDWAEAHGLAEGREVAAMRARTAAVLARRYAANRRLSESAIWLRRSATQKVPCEVARALPLAAGAALKGALRRTRTGGGSHA